jgi:endo-1,4-beta-xylanase
MRTQLSRRDFVKMGLSNLAAVYLAACEPHVKPAPTVLPTFPAAASETVMVLPTFPVIASVTVTPQPTNTSTPEPVDIPIYKNSFEGIRDLAANGITSTNNDVRINTENVDYQSGSHSLEAYGTIAAPIYSTLTIEMSLKSLTGGETVDLSNKTVGFSSFIPADSPIANINLVAKSGTKVVALAAASGFAAGEWHYQQFDLKSIYDNKAWIWTDLSNDEARDVIRNCREIMITGMRISEGEATLTSFLIDDIKWIGIDDLNHIALNDSVDSIRKYANLSHHKIGAVLIKDKNIDWFGDPWYPYTLAQEFNMTTVGGVAAPETKPADISGFNFDYTYEDQKLAFAEGHGMVVRGGTGGNHVGNPLWLLDASYDELKAFLERKIEQDISHYGGKVYSWGVFNEPVNDTGNGFRNRQQKNPNDPNASSVAPYGYGYSPFVDGNDISLIEAALIKARQMDPNAMLYINDFDNEEIGKQKSEFFYNFLIGMRNRGVPIDGGGFELHKIYPFQGDPAPDLDAYLDRIDRNLKRYAAAGLRVEFTEVECQIRFDDIDLATQAGQDELARRVQKQADMYAGLMKLAVENPNVFSFTAWTVADKPHTSAFDEPWNHFTYTDSFLFDKNYNPKPAYYAVLNVLKQQ